MNYDIKIREVAPIKAMTVRFVTNMNQISIDMPKNYQQLWEHIEKNGGQCAGDCFAVYHGEEFNPEHIDVECCFSIVQDLPETDLFKVRMVEGGQMVTTHKGPYNQLETAYHAVMKWIDDNHYLPLPNMREHYLNNPSTVSPEETLTEIVWPVKKK